MIGLTDLLAWLVAYKYWVLFPGAVVEGPLVTILGGFLVARGYLNGATVFSLVIVADLVGDMMYYALGRWGRLQLNGRLGQRLGLTPDRLTQLAGYIHEHTGATLVAGKLTHGVGVAVLAAAGAAHVPWQKFLWWNFLASLPKSLLFLWVGFYFGAAYARWQRYLNYTAWGMVLLALTAILVYGGATLVRRTYFKDTPVP